MTSRLIAIGGLVLAFSASAHDVIDRKLSYEGSKYITLGAGLGFTGFANTAGLDGETGFGLRVGAGHPLNSQLTAEIVYEFSTFRMISPDPISPTLSLDTRAALHQESIRLAWSYPDLLVQPYVSGGIGGYHFTGVNQDTALSFASNMQFPVSAGLRAYLLKDLLSIDMEFTYRFLLGEDQDADVRQLLGIDRVSFDLYSFMTSFTLHLY